jgi:uncharacterized surface protein with fasciclin (FAS1) repeats
MAADVLGLSEAETLPGEDLGIKVEDGEVMLGDAEIILTDSEAWNAFIHAIDGVLIPVS